MRVLSQLGRTHIEKSRLLSTTRIFSCLCLILTTSLSANGRPSQEERWNVQPPTKAINLVTRAEALAARNNLNKALISARQAVAPETSTFQWSGF